MKTRKILFVLVSNLLVWGPGAAGEPQGTVRSISVTGTVETKTAPDLIVWRVSLTDTGKDLRAAKATNDEKVRSVIALREKLGIEEGDLETGHLSIRREYERGQHGYRKQFRHFVITRSVTIRQRDLKRFDTFLDTLVSSAEMEVSFSFQSSRIHEVRAETRLKALKAAKEKAEAMAGVVGARLGRIITISEHPQTGGQQNYSSNVMAVTSRPAIDAGSDRFVPGAIPVRVTVYATFELQ